MKEILVFLLLLLTASVCFGNGIVLETINKPSKYDDDPVKSLDSFEKYDKAVLDSKKNRKAKDSTDHSNNKVKHVKKEDKHPKKENSINNQDNEFLEILHPTNR
jgi:hypothetical protein